MNPKIGDFMRYNPNLHNRHSIRLQNWNYANTGAYFITICCENRKCLFGEIVNGNMILNECGRIAENKWNELPQHHPNVELGEFIVMPNHIHGILKIVKNAAELGASANISPKPGTLPTIIRSYKSSVSKQINNPPVWQRNYYEHIIRNEKEYAKIAQYIHKNPIFWKKDRFNTRR